MENIKAEYKDYQNAKAVDVDFMGHGMYDTQGDLNGFMGDVKIEVKDANSANGYSSKLISGEHGLNDYEDEYGFTIIEGV
tara:strand:+ start:238 stop:477 length:240 start_codon:yes stop_codon:yes gene_type:complete